MSGSRMGAIIMEARLKKGMTEKALAKKVGLAESVIRQIEAGTRIVSDDQSQRILKALGAAGEGVTPMSAEIEAANEGPVQLRPKPRPYIIAAETPEKPLSEPEKQEVVDGANSWLDALGGVLKRVPILGEDGVVIDHRTEPVVSGKIEGGHPDKVTYFRVPDGKLAGFGIRAGDLLLTVPQPTPVDDSVMIVRRGELRQARKVKKLPGGMVMLQTFDREFEAETVSIKEVLFAGRCVHLERTL